MHCCTFSYVLPQFIFDNSAAAVLIHSKLKALFQAFWSNIGLGKIGLRDDSLCMGNENLEIRNVDDSFAAVTSAAPPGVPIQISIRDEPII